MPVKKLRWIFFLFVVFLLQCSPQFKAPPLLNSDAVLYWSQDRKLTWDDFRREPIAGDAPLACEIIIRNPASFERSSFFAPVTFDAQCYVDRTNSWFNKKYATPELLFYNQTLFDIYELYTRLLREKLSMTKFSFFNPGKTFNEVVNSTNNQLINRIKAFRTETRMGQNQEQVLKWSEQIQAELVELDEYKLIIP